MTNQDKNNAILYARAGKNADYISVMCRCTKETAKSYIRAAKDSKKAAKKKSISAGQKAADLFNG